MKKQNYRASLLVVLMLCATLSFSSSLKATPRPEEVLRQVVGLLRSHTLGYYPPLLLIERQVAPSGLSLETVGEFGTPGRSEAANATIRQYLLDGSEDTWDHALVTELNRGVAQDGLLLTVSPPFRDGDRWCCYLAMPYPDAEPGELVKYASLVVFDWDHGKLANFEEEGLLVSDRFRSSRTPRKR